MPPATNSLLPEPRRVCVIGAGLGGLALAIRLQSAGLAVTVLEARSEPGGALGSITRDGFRFDTGPAALTDPQALRALWALSGGDLADDLELLPVAPALRFNWPDGSVFDWPANAADRAREVARFAPADAAGVQALADFLAAAPARAGSAQRSGAIGQAGDIARAVPDFLRRQNWRSAYGLAAHFVKSEKLREALSLPVLLAGGNPFSTGSQALAVNNPLGPQGAWYPRGGMAALANALARRFAAIGGTLRLGDPVVRIDTIGNRVSEVETRSGWALRFGAVASNADALHSYRDLLRAASRGGDMARSLGRKRYAPGLVAVHFGLEGSWPGIPHQSVLLGPRFRGLFDDIFESGVLPRDMLIMLGHPSVTDPAAAPAGKSAFTALVPVANMGKLPIDWQQLGPLIENRVLAEIGRRLIPDLDDRIVTRFHTTPRDWALDMNWHLGSAFGLEPDRLTGLAPRVSGRDARLANFYLVGTATSPGAGLPGILDSAQRTASRIEEDTR